MTRTLRSQQTGSVLVRGPFWANYLGRGINVVGSGSPMISVSCRIALTWWPGTSAAADRGRYVRGPEFWRSSFAATTGSDADWVVKLIDVYPEDDPKLGGRPPVNGVQTTSCVDAIATVSKSRKPSKPNTRPLRFSVTCHTQNYRFKKGHSYACKSEQLVPADRPQSANVRAKHLQGEGVGFPCSKSARLSLTHLASFIQLSVESPKPIVP